MQCFNNSRPKILIQVHVHQVQIVLLARVFLYKIFNENQNLFLLKYWSQRLSDEITFCNKLRLL